MVPRDQTLPQAVWDGVTGVNGLPAPAPEHHAALVLHHLVHHDLLPIRSLLDLALLWQGFSHDAAKEYAKMAGEFGVLRAARAVNATLVRDMGLVSRAL